MQTRVAYVAVAAFLIGCGSKSMERNAPPVNTSSEVGEFFSRYEAAIKAHRREQLAGFYRPDRATVIINGARMSMTNAGIDSFYRGQWQGPVFFAFDSLRFEPLNATQWLATGGFRWLPPESGDTGHYIYLSILDRTSSGLKIRTEHETARPSLQPGR